ncbi:MAG: phosphate ABC transporter substrate-binding protein [Peptococcaceae bacterium BICA1-8]|nr:MAG: phosphate ABC transporter substrate-binding protein [Peptococcaceae bacterium BICA1-8]
MFKKAGLISLVLILALSLVVVGCGKKEDVKQEGANQEATEPAKDLTINGAGATFPYPLYSKMFAAYNKLNPEIKVNYQSIGSGGGVKQMMEETVSFGASDAFLSEEEMGKIKNGVVHVPMTIGAVAVVYNLEGISSGVKLTQETLTGIYLGTIKKWNDPKIAADNANIKLPNEDITPVFRSDGSGTTSIFTDYLSKVSSAWKEKIGAGKSVKFPVGIGGKGNEGVAGQVKQLPGSIGYVELAYATTNNLSYAKLRNLEGNFTEPSLEAASASAAGAIADMPKDTRVSIVEPAGKDAYGIVGFSWILLNEKYENQAMKEELLKLTKWMYRDGQQFAKDLHYAPIPEEIAKLNDNNLTVIK